MKKTILLCLLLTGCNYSHHTRAQDRVQQCFPNSQVVRLPEHTDAFIIRDVNGNIWYAECSNLSSTPIVTGKVMLIKGDARQ